MDLHAGELALHLLTAEDAERVVRGQLAPGERWARGYPSIIQVDFLEAYVLEARSSDRAHHWQSQIRRRSDGMVVGGAGITGPADADGTLIIGYELVDEVSDAAHGRDIVAALIDVARGRGARRVATDVFDDDPIRYQVYLDAGLAETRREGRVVYLAREV